MTKMHIRLLGLGIIALSILNSCTTFRQIFEVSSPDVILFDNDYFVDTSSNLEIIYDFWSEGGIPFIEIVNSYDDTVFIDFIRSYFTFDELNFSFAPKYHQDTLKTFSSQDGYNVMNEAMPAAVYIAPDSSFLFESIPWNHYWYQEVKRKKPSKRFLYSTSPLKLDNIFVFTNPENKHQFDSLKHRLYVSNIEQMEKQDFALHVKSIQLSNKFYVKPDSGSTADGKFNLASTLLNLFISAN